MAAGSDEPNGTVYVELRGIASPWLTPAPTAWPRRLRWMSVRRTTTWSAAPFATARYAFITAPGRPEPRPPHTRPEYRKSRVPSATVRSDGIASSSQ